MVQPGSVARSHLWERPFIVMDSLAFYIAKILFPLQLCIDYGRNRPWLLQSGTIWYSWLLPVGLAATVFFLYRRRHKLLQPIDLLPAVGLLILVAAPLPVLGLVSFDFEAFSIVSDHYLYTALLGPAICVAWAVAKSPRPFFIAVCALLTLYVAKSAVQAATWQNESTLMNHTLAVNPKSCAAYNNLANDYSRDNNLPAAGDALRRALELAPDDPSIESNLVWHYLNTNQINLAEFYARQVIKDTAYYYGSRSSFNSDAYARLIRMYVDAHRLDDAERYLDEAISRFPKNDYFRTRRTDIDALRRDPNFEIDRSPGVPSSAPATQTGG